MGLLGVQEPTFSVVPDPVDLRTADEAIELAAIAGLDLLPWESEQVRRILAFQADGDYAATRHGLCVARQNGKGVVLEVVVLAKAVLLGERILWTAHEVRTMQESFQRFRALFEATPALSSLVGTVRTANGQEKILFTSGAEVKFTARSKSATRGLGFRSIVCDEAQELDYLTFGAILPTLSGQGAARTQLIVTGTPPYSRKGEVFTDFRATAYTGGDDRLSWSEWACERTDSPADKAVWARTNPSMGVVVMESKIANEWATLQSRPDVFRRERLGEWGRSGDNALALDEALWAAGATDALPARDRRYVRSDGPVRVLGVDSTWNAEMTTLVEVLPLEGSLLGIEVLGAAAGLDWVSQAISEVRKTTPFVHVAFDPMRTGDLAGDLRAAGVRQRVHPATSRDLTMACDGLVRAVREGYIQHADPRLDAAAAGATRSTFNDGQGWKLVGINGTDVSPLIGAALALRVLVSDVRPVDPTKRRTAIVF